ncbi:MAG: HupE/UreJ family protein, partial [Alphaproteobacteria bacterium]|nr:HupE/UreJ family protein [Alphaproteobacteria bacterium]
MTARAGKTSARPLAALLLSILVAALGWGVADAHTSGLSTARIIIGLRRDVDVDVSLRGSDVDLALGTKVFDAASGTVQADALAAAAAAIAAYARRHAVVLGADGRQCRPETSTVAPDGDGVAVHTRWACAGIGGALHYRSTMLTDALPGARQVAVISAGNGIAQDFLDATRNEITLFDGRRPAGGVERYAAAGAAYGFVGHQHIAFLLTLVLWARRMRPAAAVFAAFAIAHSLTFWLATLHVLRLPGAIVQPAVAASVVCAAAANFWSRDAGGRWRIAFAFGLLHGFGFAAALRAFGMPDTARLSAIAAFNLGVEVALGELAVIALWLLLGLDRWSARRAHPVSAPSRSALAYPLS